MLEKFKDQFEASSTCFFEGISHYTTLLLRATSIAACCTTVLIALRLSRIARDILSLAAM
jgi:hypothetical protein